MPDHDSQTPPINWRLTSFEGARREQLRRWAQLPLEVILQAIEEMGDLSRQLGTAPAIDHEETPENHWCSEGQGKCK
ncbi:MAG: hypothetical protein AB1555_10095 [Nitrospirota bacterium]